MDLSIVVVHWNAWSALAGCLESLSGAVRGWPGEVEVLVIDNASTEDRWDSVVGQFAKCALLRNKSNLGFARACNQGIQRSNGSLVMFLNPDTEVPPDALEELTGYLERHPRVGAAGPLLLNRDGTFQPSAFGEPGIWSELLRLFHLKDCGHDPGRRRKTWSGSASEAQLLSGACLIVRRSVLDEVGWFDPQFHMYNEDYDLCRRIRAAGWRLAWVPAARVLHIGGQSSRLNPSEMFVELYRSKMLYFRKHYGKWRADCYKLLLILVALSRQPLSLIPGRKARDLRRIAGFYRLLMTRLASL